MLADQVEVTADERSVMIVRDEGAVGGAMIMRVGMMFQRVGDVTEIETGAGTTETGTGTEVVVEGVMMMVMTITTRLLGVETEKGVGAAQGVERELPDIMMMTTTDEVADAEVVTADGEETGTETTLVERRTIILPAAGEEEGHDHLNHVQVDGHAAETPVPTMTGAGGRGDPDNSAKMAEGAGAGNTRTTMRVVNAVVSAMEVAGVESEMVDGEGVVTWNAMAMVKGLTTIRRVKRDGILRGQERPEVWSARVTAGVEKAEQKEFLGWDHLPQLLNLTSLI
mmetsp:Transcript_23843/g.34970  ORF Transcript_23843/g.34970 Transcript_23843/m.34970 type:complete len:282 (+) Transcript_23843:601-1446(+)